MSSIKTSRSILVVIAIINLIWISNAQADLEKKTVEGIKAVVKKLQACKEASAELKKMAKDWDSFVKVHVESNQEMRTKLMLMLLKLLLTKLSNKLLQELMFSPVKSVMFSPVKSKMMINLQN